MTDTSVLLSSLSHMGSVLLSLNTLIAGFITFVVCKYVQNKWLSPLGKIPGPWHTSLTSLVYFIKTAQGEKVRYMQKAHREYGPLVRIGPNMVSAADPKALRQIHTSHKFTKANFYEAFKAENEHNVFTMSDLVAFKKRKHLVASLYSLSSIASHEHVIHEVGISKLKARLQKAAESGETLDIMKYFSFLSLDVISELGFGGSFNALDTDGHPCTRWMSEATNLRILKHIMGDLIPPLLAPHWAKSDQAIIQYGWDVLRRRKSDPNPPSDLLQRLIEGTDEDGNQLTDRAVVSEILAQIVAGTDTTATMLTWIMHALLDHPIWFDRIYHELKTELDGPPETVSSATLARLPILNAVINETMRILPAAQQDWPRNVPPEGAVLAGKFIPGGTTVRLQMYAVHTDPNLWEEPEKFMPERWLKENPTDALNEAIPFSHGVRACIGRNLAEAELRMTWSMLIYYFEFERVGNDDMTCDSLFLSKPRCGRLTVKVTERVTSSI